MAVVAGGTGPHNHHYCNQPYISFKGKMMEKPWISSRTVFSDNVHARFRSSIWPTLILFLFESCKASGFDEELNWFCLVHLMSLCGVLRVLRVSRNPNVDVYLIHMGLNTFDPHHVTEWDWLTIGKPGNGWVSRIYQRELPWGFWTCVFPIGDFGLLSAGLLTWMRYPGYPSILN